MNRWEKEHAARASCLSDNNILITAAVWLTQPLCGLLSVSSLFETRKSEQEGCRCTTWSIQDKKTEYYCLGQEKKKTNNGVIGAFLKNWETFNSRHSKSGVLGEKMLCAAPFLWVAICYRPTLTGKNDNGAQKKCYVDTGPEAFCGAGGAACNLIMQLQWCHTVTKLHYR